MMRMLLIIYAGADPTRVTMLLDTQEVAGYTVLGDARGTGASGRREGTRAWPGRPAVIFTTVAAAAVDRLTAALAALRAGLPADERLHIAVLPVETFV